MDLFTIKKMPTAFYGVAVGKNIGVYYSWDECKEQVLNYPNAKYKKFDSEIEARTFVDMYKVKEDTIDYSNYFKVYTDGSNLDNLIFAFGFVILDPDNKVLYKAYQGFKENKLSVHRNISGECFGVLQALKYCKEHNIHKILVYHDYIGLKHWAEGSWKTNSPIAVLYKEKIDEFRKNNDFDFQFVWVKGHNKDKWNEEADRLAKLGLYNFKFTVET